MEEKINELAMLMYDNYCMAVGGKAFNGDKLPTSKDFFSDDSKKLQVNAWKSAAATSKTFFELNPELIGR